MRLVHTIWPVFQFSAQTRNRSSSQQTYKSDEIDSREVEDPVPFSYFFVIA